MRSNNVEVILYKVGQNHIEIPISADPSDFLQNVNYLTPFSKKYKENYSLRPHLAEGKKPELQKGKLVGDLTTWDAAQDVNKYIQTNYKDKYQIQLKMFKAVFIAFDFNGKLNSNNVELMWKALNGKMKISNRLKFVMLKNGDKVLIIKKGIDFFDGLDKTKKELL